MAHSERLAHLVKTSPAMAWLVGVGAMALKEEMAYAIDKWLHIISYLKQLYH